MERAAVTVCVLFSYFDLFFPHYFLVVCAWDSFLVSHGGDVVKLKKENSKL